MKAFLEVQGMWYPLEFHSSRVDDGIPTEDETVVYSFGATITTQGMTMVRHVEKELDEYMDEIGEEGEGPESKDLISYLNYQASENRDFSNFKDLSPEAMAKIMLQWFGESSPGVLSNRDRLAIAAFANILGPDWAQHLYIFAVKVTKLV